MLVNNINNQLIEQSYNANPETMIESIRNFSKIKNKGYQKILILGEMNELGLDALKFHILIIKETTQHVFDKVILSGDLFKKALKMFPSFKNSEPTFKQIQTTTGVGCSRRRAHLSFWCAWHGF